MADESSERHDLEYPKTIFEQDAGNQQISDGFIYDKSDFTNAVERVKGSEDSTRDEFASSMALAIAESRFRDFKTLAENEIIRSGGSVDDFHNLTNTLAGVDLLPADKETKEVLERIATMIIELRNSR